ncbi:MAG: hypothetical protein ABI543_09755 [Ignavibacteria bacterium]
MNKIKWDEKFFEQSGIYLWIYSRGCLVRTNDRFRNSVILKNFKKYQPKKFRDTSIKH